MLSTPPTQSNHSLTVIMIQPILIIEINKLKKTIKKRQFIIHLLYFQH